jgi:hypothetical protein
MIRASGHRATAALIGRHRQLEILDASQVLDQLTSVVQAIDTMGKMSARFHGLQLASDWWHGWQLGHHGEFL